MKILWLAPQLNHYKAKFLDRLAQTTGYNITVLAGGGRSGKGDAPATDYTNLVVDYVAVKRIKFGFSIIVRRYLKENLKNFDIVMLPAETKNLHLLFYTKLLQKRLDLNSNKSVKIITYNHPLIKLPAPFSPLNKLVTKLMFSLYDRVIFYSEESHHKAINKKLIKEDKAYWANNTIDSKEISQRIVEREKPLYPPRLLFIGRLVKYKMIDLLFKLFDSLKENIPDLELHIIGDGPEYSKVNRQTHINKSIYYHGMLSEEIDISKVINICDFVIVPGHSGLSINHAFAYGKPYITSSNYKSHPPEYGYLKPGVNSILLSGHFEEDVDLLTHVLTDSNLYNKLHNGALDFALSLSLELWIQQMQYALNTEFQ